MSAQAPASGLSRHVLNGPTMGTRWSALFDAPPEADDVAISAALQAAVDRVDLQMSPYKPASELSVLNRSPLEHWVDLPDEMFAVIEEALEINALTGGAFDPFVGSPVLAWGFGANGTTPDKARIDEIGRNWAEMPREIGFDRNGRRLCRRSEVALDLCGIAKGYGVDRLSEVLSGFGIDRHLVAIDGEVRAEGVQADGSGWSIAIERPDESARDAVMALEITDMAVATSGTYRHVQVTEAGKVSHTIDPRTGAPVTNSLLSATVLSDTTMLADALATGLMVMGPDEALAFAERSGLAALLIEKEEKGGLRLIPTGRFQDFVGLLVAN